MSLVALDLGQRTGWASLDYLPGSRESPGGRTLSSGVRLLNPKDPVQIRFGNFLVFLRELLDKDDTVYYEQAQRFANSRVAFWFGGLEAVLMVACLELNIVPRGVNPMTLKKAATGSGKAFKIDMVEKAQAVLSGFGQVRKAKMDHNEADALCLLWCAAKGKV